MTTPGTFACPSCAAPLTPEGDAPEIKCPYCGSVVVVPQELRPHHHDQAGVNVSGTTFTFDQQPQVIVQQPNQLGPQVAELLELEREMVSPMIPVMQQAAARRAARRGCGCSGCFATLIFLIIFGAVALGILASVSPSFVAGLISNIPGLEDLNPSILTSPTILIFTASPTSVNGGDPITVVWGTNAESVRLDMTGKSPQTINSLPAAGSRTFSTSSNDTSVTIRITATKSGKTTTKSLTVTVKPRSRSQ